MSTSTIKMKCAKCSSDNIYVIDSRQTEMDGQGTVRRRRACRKCRWRWSTIEVPLGERRRHDAIKVLADLRVNLNKVLTKIDEFNKGGENEKS